MIKPITMSTDNDGIRLMFTCLLTTVNPLDTIKSILNMDNVTIIANRQYDITAKLLTLNKFSNIKFPL